MKRHINMNDRRIFLGLRRQRRRWEVQRKQRRMLLTQTKMSSYINQLLFFFNKIIHAQVHTHKRTHTKPILWACVFSSFLTQSEQTKRFCKISAVTIHSYCVWNEKEGESIDVHYTTTLYFYFLPVLYIGISLRAIFLPCEITLSHSDSYH